MGETLGLSSPPPTAEWAARTASTIWRRLEAHAFAGLDPYDALNATRVPSVVLQHRVTRRVLTQAVKRCPVPLQPVLGVPEQADAYTLGHALLAAARLAAASGGSDCPAASSLLHAGLRESATQGDGWSAWGHHFPVRRRLHLLYAKADINALHWPT